MTKMQLGKQGLEKYLSSRVFEELGVEQPSTNSSRVSEKVPVPKSTQKRDRGRREDLSRPDIGRQPRSQPQVKTGREKKSRPQTSVHLPFQGRFRSTGKGLVPKNTTKTAVTPVTLRAVPSVTKFRKGSRMTLVLYGLRLLILGIGISTIAGTLLSILEPTSRLKASQTEVQAYKQEIASAETFLAPNLKLTQEIMPLKTVVQQLAAKNANLMPGVFFVELETGAYLDLNGAEIFAAASTIKFPILVAFLQDVDAGKIRLDEMLTLKQELIGGGSGSMQYAPIGTKFTALDTATKMITISDNAATNMLIARLGGAAALNQRFENWGLTVTQIRNPLPDLSGTNTTSPRDLAHLMASVNQKNFMSFKSRDRLLDIMRRTTTNTLLPPGLGQGATIAHKTGDIKTLVGDVGLVDMPSGKRYIAIVMVKRLNNDSRAQELIRQISRAAYQQFNILPTTLPIIKQQTEQ